MLFFCLFFKCGGRGLILGHDFWPLMVDFGFRRLDLGLSEYIFSLWELFCPSCRIKESAKIPSSMLEKKNRIKVGSFFSKKGILLLC